MNARPLAGSRALRCWRDFSSPTSRLGGTMVSWPAPATPRSGDTVAVVGWGTLVYSRLMSSVGSGNPGLGTRANQEETSPFPLELMLAAALACQRDDAAEGAGRDETA